MHDDNLKADISKAEYEMKVTSTASKSRTGQDVAAAPFDIYLFEDIEDYNCYIE